MKLLRQMIQGLALMTAAASVWAAHPVVEMQTNQGTIKLELYEDKAPKTVANFLQYAKSGFYNGTVFHRVIDGFMIQGGGFTPAMEEKATRAPIVNEAPQSFKAGLRNQPGTIAMARTNEPHSATAQFFINVANNNRLDPPSYDGWGYCVFGKVIQGMEVVQRIAKQPTTAHGPHQDVPVTPVLIQSVKVLPGAN